MRDAVKWLKEKGGGGGGEGGAGGCSRKRQDNYSNSNKMTL